jgi:sialate O-acetylesterase
MLRFLSLAAALAAAAAASAATPFALSNTLGDHMVLQRDAVSPPAAIFGVGPAGSAVSVSWDGGAAMNATIGADSTWRVPLPPTPAGGPHTVLVKCGGGACGTAALEDVLMGDVYMVTGQSNAVFAVAQAFNASEEIAAVGDNYPTIRLFTASPIKSASPQVQLPRVELPWSVASSSSVGGPNWSYISAAGWFFARDLWTALRGEVPIGLFVDAFGGTIIQEWSSAAALAVCPQGPNPVRAGMSNSDLWNSMVLPVTVGPMAFKAVVIYQAESNIDQPGPGMGGDYYACQFPATIASWRAALHAPALPWIFVQLAAYTAKSGWEKDTLPDMRAGQLAAAALPPTSGAAGEGEGEGAPGPWVWYATAMDLGDYVQDPPPPWTDIHPRFKKPVGARIAAVASALLYGMPVAYRGAEYGSSSVVGGAPAGSVAIHVRFDAASLPAGGTVVYAPGQACPPSYNATAFCAAFEVIFSDGNTVGVDAHAPVLDPDGRGLTITAPVPAGSPAPSVLATRYAWAPWPVTSLYTQAGWPVMPWWANVTAAA